MEKLGIYCRVSSKGQENDGTSIDYQLKKGSEISKKLGMKSVIFNEGGKTSWSSNINTRPELIRMLNDIESKRIKHLWVWSMDRLGRNSDSWYSILKILMNWKVNVYIGESTNSSDFGNLTDRLTIQILTLISTYDNELRRTRMMFGKMESLKKGQTFIGGTKTFGYDVDENKRLIPNQSEKKIIKKMFEMYRNGKSTTDIQVMLNSSEHKPKRSKRGWNIGTIQKMLHNQIYIGKQVWNWKEKEPDESYTIVETIEINTPKLISKKLYNDVQKRLKKYQIHNQYDTKLTSLLKGLLVCSHCGFKLNHRFKNGQKPKYYCVYNERKWKENNNKELKKKKTCNMGKSLIMEQSNEIVWNEFLYSFSNSKWIREQFKEEKYVSIKNKEDKEIKSLLQSFRVKKTKLTNTKNSLIDSLVEVEIKKSMGGFELEIVYERILEKVNKQISETIIKIDEIDNEISVLNNSFKFIDWVKEMGSDIEKMNKWSFEKKKDKLNKFLSSIEVSYSSKTDKHNLMFNFKLPIVDDILIWNDKTDKKKGYQIKNGKKSKRILFKNDYTHTIKVNKKKLLKIMLELKSKEMSYSEISDYLNQEKLKSLRGNSWTRQLVRKYFINIDLDLQIKKKRILNVI